MAPDSAADPSQQLVSGLAATMTVIAMGVGYALAVADPTILSANMSLVRTGLDASAGTASFIASLATLTMAAVVLGAGALGDLYGMRRMYVVGLVGTTVFGVVAAAAPSAVVLIVARAGIGVALAFLLGLSLAIVNSVFPPGRRSTAIALYLGAGLAIATPMPAVGSILATEIGWRASFLVTPVIALITLLITIRYVPETPRAQRRLDVPGLVLIAVGLIGVIYGLSRLETGINPSGLAAIGIGLVAIAGFVLWELHTPQPALDLRIFRLGRFNAAAFAGLTFNFLVGGSTLVFAVYLVAVRGESPRVLAFLLIPAIALAALAAAGAGPAAARLGDRAVLVAGLAVLLVGLLVMRAFDLHTSTWVVFLAVALNSVGGAVVSTPQATIMMANAPADLGGTVSAAKCAVNQAGYSFGPAVFGLIGVTLFVRDGMQRLAGSGITYEQAREALRVSRGGAGPAGTSHAVDPEQARIVVAAATQSMLDAIHTLSLTMVAAPVAAIVMALLFVDPKVPRLCPRHPRA